MPPQPTSTDPLSIPPTGHLTWRQADQAEKTRRTLVRAEGVYLYYDDGTRHIDASGGPVAVGVGHGREEIARAAYDQMRQVAYGFEVDAVRRLFSMLRAFTPGDLNRFYPCSGGSEAVEAALRFARHYHVLTGRPSKHKVIARWVSYHGNTLGAASLSGSVPRRRVIDPMLIPFPHVEPCYCYRCPFGRVYPECEVLCAEKLEETILREGPDTVAAFIAEPIVGATAGCLLPPPDYFPRVRAICDRYDVLFIADEVMTGFGRTGRNFAIEHWNVLPDLMTMAKGLTSGYIPMGMLAVRETLMSPAEPRVTDFGNILTYSYHPVAAAVACAVLDILNREGLVERSRWLGGYLLERLRPLARHPLVGDIRGLGLFAGVELVRDRATGEPFPVASGVAERVLRACRRRGVALYSGAGMIGGTHGDHVMISPPFIVTEAQIDEIVAALSEALDEVAAELTVAAATP